MKFKKGDRVRVTFRRGDGTWFRRGGVIVRLWGKGPHAADVHIQNYGGIRAGINELRKI